MLYHFLYSLVDQVGGLNVIHYITVRGIIALLTALAIGLACSPWFIKKLKSGLIGQQVRNEGPKSHFSKAGTPTMGGTLILFSALVPALLWMDWSNAYLWLAFIITLGFGVVGFFDDYLKVSKKNTKGLAGKRKLIIEFILAGLVCTWYYTHVDNSGTLFFPFLKDFRIDLGMAYIPFAMFTIVGASNAVNLTDGLDGLAIGLVIVSAACFMVLSYVTGHAVIADYLNYPYIKGSGELAIFAACLVGAGIGFLWFNGYPAQIFMGDVGSLPLGAALGALAVFTKHEVLLAIMGGVFVMEAISVIGQVASFKMTGKRIFRMAPIHHHFELKGWSEPKVIVRFWIISIILALISLISLKVR